MYKVTDQGFDNPSGSVLNQTNLGTPIVNISTIGTVAAPASTAVVTAPDGTQFSTGDGNLSSIFAIGALFVLLYVVNNG